METRRIQLTGGSSLAVTLPKKWTDRFGLKGKDSVRFYTQRSGLLVVQPDSHREQIRRAVLNVQGLTGDAVVRELMALYISGSDEVLVKSAGISRAQRNRVREINQLLIGFEIISESSEEMLIRNVLDPTKLPTVQNIEKMFVIAEAMFRDAMTAVMKHDESLAQDVIDRDFEMDKLYLMLLRQFTVSLQGIVHDEEVGLSQLDLNYYNQVATQLERIADHAVRIAGTLADEQTDRGKCASSHLPKAMETILPLLSTTARMVHALEKPLAHAVLDQNAQIEKFLYQASKNSCCFQEKIVVDSLDRLRGYLMNIAEMTIDQAAIRWNDHQVPFA